MKEHTVCCLNLEHIQVMTMCRQFPELIHINGIESPNVKLNQQATPGQYYEILWFTMI